MKASKPGKRRQQRRPSRRKRKARQVTRTKRLSSKQGSALPLLGERRPPDALPRLSSWANGLPPTVLRTPLLLFVRVVTACCAWLRAPLLRQWRHGLPALTLVALLSAAFAVASCSDSAAGEESDAGGDTAQLDDARDDRLDKDEEDDGIVWINELTSADTILLTDLTGSSLGELDGLGRRKTEVSLHPYGLARYDDSRETNVFVDSPRDRSVELDHMGARFYSPELGIWTSADPAILTNPEQYVTAEFAAANPYAYANLRPVIAADRDGQFWHIAAGAAVGGLLGGGGEALSQYLEHGKIEDWGRVGAATGGGAAGGLIAVTNPAAALSTVMGGGAASSALTGITQRLIASGGKSAGTLTEVAIDAGVGAGSAGIVKGGASLLRKVVPKKVVAPASKGAVAKAGEAAASPRLLPAGNTVPNAGGKIVSFVSQETDTYYRVFSGASTVGGFLTRAKPRSSAFAREALALPPSNQASFLQEVVVPAGTRLQRSRSLPAFGRRGGGEQFELLDEIPVENFGIGVSF